MTADPEATAEPARSPGADGSGAPAFSPDEPQPSSAIHEHDALSEREDGVNRGGPDDVASPLRRPDGAIPAIVLNADEQQPIAAIAEHNALSEREDGTNRG